MKNKANWLIVVLVIVYILGAVVFLALLSHVARSRSPDPDNEEYQKALVRSLDNATLVKELEDVPRAGIVIGMSISFSEKPPLHYVIVQTQWKYRNKNLLLAIPAITFSKMGPGDKVLLREFQYVNPSVGPYHKDRLQFIRIAMPVSEKGG